MLLMPLSVAEKRTRQEIVEIGGEHSVVALLGGLVGCDGLHVVEWSYSLW